MEENNLKISLAQYIRLEFKIFYPYVIPPNDANVIVNSEDTLIWVCTIWVHACLRVVYLEACTLGFDAIE